MVRPVVISTAVIASFLPRTYRTSPTATGLNPNSELLPPAGTNAASRRSLTLDLLIWSNPEYWAESEFPRQSDQDTCSCLAVSELPASTNASRSSAKTKSSAEIPALRYFTDGLLSAGLILTEWPQAMNSALPTLAAVSGKDS